MSAFTPDYRNIELAARNIEPPRLPLYEHLISDGVMEKVLAREFKALISGGPSDIDEYFKNYNEFFRVIGYDAVTYEGCVTAVMPGSGALVRHTPGVIRDRSDFEAYPWDGLSGMYFDRFSEHFNALRRNMPSGMRAVGGVGNGVFECVQDIVGYTELSYISADDPELYSDLFARMGDVLYNIWRRLITEFGDIFCVFRFGDDLGYKSNTMLSTDDISALIIPQYARIVELAHKAGKPFLLHSCGQIFSVMDELITVAKINAKHSNEDQIATFDVWVERYGDRIGNFGGIDTDVVCRYDRASMSEYILDMIGKCSGHGGFAFGSGNSIPDYVPLDGYLNMIETVREYRGDFR